VEAKNDSFIFARVISLVMSVCRLVSASRARVTSVMTASETCMTCNGVVMHKDHIEQQEKGLSRKREGEERAVQLGDLSDAAIDESFSRPSIADLFLLRRGEKKK